MLRVTLEDGLLRIEFATFVDFEIFEKTVDLIKQIPGRRYREEYWTIPPEEVETLISFFPGQIQWNTSLAEIREVTKSVMPKFEVETDGLDDLKIQPYPFQFIGSSFLHDMEFGMLADEMGLGKAQPLDAKILTPYGWKLMGDIQVGDEVIGSSGKFIKVLGVFPQGVKDIYRVTFSDKSSTECCEEHLWTINTTTRRFRGNPYFVKQLKDIKGDLKLKSGNFKYFIPMVAPVQFNEKPLPVNPYILGCLLGDGSFRGNTITLTSADNDIVSYFKNNLPPYVELKFDGDIGYRITGTGERFETNQFTSDIRSLGLMGHLSNSKFIPDIFKFSSVENRLKLLRGLLDTDGHIRPKDGHIEFCSVSRQLAEDTQFLIQSLGGNARINKNKTTHQDRYRVTIRMPDGLNPFKLQRKADIFSNKKIKHKPSRAIASVEFIGRKEAQCIRVDAPDSLYVTDDFIITHNTIQVIAAIHRLAKEGRVNKALIVCPSSLKYQWGQEIEKFTECTYTIIDGTPEEREEMYNTIKLWPPLFTIINYELVLKDVEYLKELNFNVIACDEAHRLKNWKSKTSDAIKELSNISRRWLLTGTPMQNRPEELFNLFSFLNSNILGGWWSFRARYIIFGRKYGKDNVPLGTKNLGELNKRISKYMLRRLKVEVAPDLPKINIINRFVNMTDDQTKLHELIREDLIELSKEINSQKKNYDDEHPKDGQILGMLTLLQEVCDTPELLAMSESGMARKYAIKNNKSPKLDELTHMMTELIESDSTAKSVIFTRFERLQQIIVKRLTPIGGCVILNGSMKPLERQQAIDKFKQDPNIKFFISTDAGNYGVNLECAKVLVNVDLPWNPAVHEQRNGRIHRLNSKHDNVYIYNLISVGGIDERMLTVLYDKKALAEQIIEKDEEQKQINYKLTSNVIKKLLSKGRKKKGA